MINAESIDLTGLENVIDTLKGVLYAKGMNSDAQNVLKDEGKRLARRIADLMPPRTKDAGAKKIERDVRLNLTPDPNLFDDEQRGHGDITWLGAGPTFLVGAPTPMMALGASDKAAARLMKARAGSVCRRTRLGARWMQTIWKISRTVVTRAAFRGVLKMKRSHVGEMKASFAATAQKLGDHSLPNWISRHIPTPKNITDDSLLNAAEMAVLTFGSTAPGVSKQYVVDAVRRATEERRRIILSRIQQLLFGYANDHNSGRKIKHHA